MKFKNKTNSIQHINLINGKCISVPAGESETIAENEIYDFEKDRLMSFFEIENEQVKKPVKSKQDRLNLKTESQEKPEAI
jgi:hypothetical protein